VYPPLITGNSPLDGMPFISCVMTCPFICPLRKLGPSSLLGRRWWRRLHNGIHLRLRRGWRAICAPDFSLWLRIPSTWHLLRFFGHGVSFRMIQHQETSSSLLERRRRRRLDRRPSLGLPRGGPATYSLDDSVWRRIPSSSLDESLWRRIPSFIQIRLRRQLLSHDPLPFSVR
jgi:hypothetical protein